VTARTEDSTCRTIRYRLNGTYVQQQPLTRNRIPESFKSLFPVSFSCIFASYCLEWKLTAGIPIRVPEDSMLYGSPGPYRDGGTWSRGNTSQTGKDATKVARHHSNTSALICCLQRLRASCRSTRHAPACHFGGV
jgi:hypothetical protein